MQNYDSKCKISLHFTLEAILFIYEFSSIAGLVEQLKQYVLSSKQQQLYLTYYSLPGSSEWTHTGLRSSSALHSSIWAMLHLELAHF